MDQRAREHLEEQVFEKVWLLLSMRDHSSMQGLSPAAFLEALESELHFLGLYPDNDRETAAVIHSILEQHLDLWYAHYLSQSDSTTSSVQPAASEIPVMHSAPCATVPDALSEVMRLLTKGIPPARSADSTIRMSRRVVSVTAAAPRRGPGGHAPARTAAPGAAPRPSPGRARGPYSRTPGPA